MRSIDVVGTASALPDAWSSRSLGDVGTARVKVLRMDGGPVPEEAHGAAEVLLVLDGRLELSVEGAEVAVGAVRCTGCRRVPGTPCAPAAAARW